jgi:hypothetical protein
VRYLLVVVTHGSSPHLARTLHAFSEWVTPRPAYGLLWVDGPDEDDAAAEAAMIARSSWKFTGSAVQRGFCATYTDAWDEAVITADDHECDFVFWLESDFLIRRAVNLAHLAALLDASPELAQVALMRNPVNEQEVAAGGLFESRPGEYELESFETEEVGSTRVRLRSHSWLRHRSYYTTNPNLMRRSFMADHPWPERHAAQCEGLYTMDLRACGYDFAVWGSGDAWVEHVGVRTGFGY